MKLVIAGATGRIGGLLLEQALAAGHDVTAIVRNPARLPVSVPAVTADLTTVDPDEIAEALGKAQGVLSAVGPSGRGDGPVTSAATRTLIAAMTKAKARRLIVISAAPVGTVASPARPVPRRRDAGDGLLTSYLLTPVIKRVFAAAYADLAQAEDALRASSLDWTALRPPRLTDGPLTGTYELGIGRNIRGGLTVSRADVAHAMLAILRRPETLHTTVGIGSKLRPPALRRNHSDTTATGAAEPATPRPIKGVNLLQDNNIPE